MLKTITIPALIIALSLSACATPTAKIKPAPVTHDISCAERPRVDRDLATVTEAQNKNVATDRIAAMTAFWIFLPAVVLIKGNKHKPDVARLKGEDAALITKGC